MPVSAKQQIGDFFKKTKRSVAKVQENMIESAMSDLFEKSPHMGDPESRYSKSEYDANHKVRINHGLVSPHIPPTQNPGVSFMAHHSEKQKAEQIKCGDRVEIFNTTLHNHEVEYGGPTWQRPGYYTYQKTLFNLKRDYQDVTG